ncbi:MAG: Methionyl-tRNA formyltransferase [Cellvibrionales bacterium UBA7375]|nr:MAG: Methionyl-tRNA formyltransferase [Cellvibrionales bacterium UBA7375]
MKIIFAGTPDFAAAHLRALIDCGQHEIVAVYTQPDRPAGRGKKLTASAVKQLASEQGLTVLQPPSLKEADAQQQLAGFAADLMIVVAYGLILPQAVLDTPRLGCINVHGSLLPKWRGAAPIQRAVEAGDDETGICIMQMDAGLDTGPVISVARCAIEATDTSGSIYQKLSALGAPTLLAALEKLASGVAVAEQQDDSQSTYASKIDKAEALIDWATPAETLARKVRAFNPFPATFSHIGGERVKIWAASANTVDSRQAVGAIVAASDQGILVQTASGQLLISEIQLAGKSKMPVSELLKSKAELFAAGQSFDQ